MNYENLEKIRMKRAIKETAKEFKRTAKKIKKSANKIQKVVIASKEKCDRKRKSSKKTTVSERKIKVARMNENEIASEL